MSAWPRLAAWATLLFALAVTCAASLVDQLARVGVLVAASPILTDGGSVRLARAEEARQRGDLVAASRDARAALIRRPVDATALRVAGAVAIARGDVVRGDALMRLAGAAGWRDVPTQLYWGEVAIDGGDFDVAAQRLEAVARLGDRVGAQALLVRLEKSAGGRAALVRQWDGTDRWLPGTLTAWPADSRAAADRLALLRLLKPRLDRSSLNRIATTLIDSGRLAAAFALLRPDARKLAFVAEPAVGPLDWQVGSGVGLQQVDVLGDGGLRVVAAGPALIVLATRIVRLPSGANRVTLRTAGAKTDLPVILTMRCLAGDGGAVVPVSGRAGQAAFDVQVPPGCLAQRLELFVAGEEARRGADLTLSPPIVTRGDVAP